WRAGARGARTDGSGALGALRAPARRLHRAVARAGDARQRDRAEVGVRSSVGFAIALVATLFTAAMVTPCRAAVPARSATPAQRFHEAGELARAGDYPKAIAIYGRLAASGVESAPLYWNWAQAALAEGATGEA